MVLVLEYVQVQIGKYIQESDMAMGNISDGGKYFLSHEITVLPKLVAKRLTRWTSIMCLASLVSVLFQVGFNMRKAVGKYLSVVDQTKLPSIVVQKAVEEIAWSMVQGADTCVYSPP